MDRIEGVVAPEALRAGAHSISEDEFSRWAISVADFLTPHYKRFTQFPRYFEVQALNFLVMRRLLPDYFPLGQRYGSILEIGCGVGLHSLLLSPFADRLLGVDIPGEYLGYTPPGFSSSAAMSRALVNDLFGVHHAEFKDAFPAELPLPDASVDLVYSWTVLEHVPDLPSAYREMVRVLKPGGIMLHVVPNIMSAIETIARVNVEAAKTPTAQEPLGWIGALRHLWGLYRGFAQGFGQKPPPGMVIPQCHSEFLTDYGDQLSLYMSDSYIFPALRLGMLLERLTLVRDFNHALVFRKPTIR